MGQIGRLIEGIRLYWEGVAWLKKHPGYFLLLLIPTFVGILSAYGFFSLFSEYDEQLYSYILFEPGDSFFWVLLYRITRFLVSLAVMALALLAGFLVSNVVSVPVYDMVSVAIEKDVLGHAPQISLWDSLKLIPEELKKVIAILLISFSTLLLPGLNFLTIPIAAFLVGWDFYDYPLARRGWSFRKRFQYVSGDMWAVMGLGLWLTIPFVQLVLYPFTVAGGTLLSLERLKREHIQS